MPFCLPIERSFGAGHVVIPRIERDGLSQCPRDGLKNGFGNVVVIGAVGNGDVQIQLGAVGERLEEFFDQFGGESSNVARFEGHIVNEGGAAGEIDGDLSERFVHGNVGPAVAVDAAFVAQGFFHACPNTIPTSSTV